MENFCEIFINGAVGLFIGKTVSYYAYFTMVLANICYMSKYFPEHVTEFSMLSLANFIIIVMFAALKKICLCTRKEILVSIMYWVFMASILVLECRIDFVLGMFCFFMPLLFAYVWQMLRKFQLLCYIESKSILLRKINILFNNCVVELLCLVLMYVIPFIIVVFFLNMILPSKLLVFLLTFLYGMSLPLIVIFEDFVGNDMFEIGYKILWTKDIGRVLSYLKISKGVLYSKEFLTAIEEYKKECKQNARCAELELVSTLIRMQMNYMCYQDEIKKK